MKTIEGGKQKKTGSKRTGKLSRNKLSRFRKGGIL